MRFSHRCPSCKSVDAVRIPGLSDIEDLLAYLFIWRYRCRQCNWPFIESAFKLHRVREHDARSVSRRDPQED